MELLIVFVIAFVASLLSSMSGGGTGIIIFPAYLFMGLPYPLVASIAQVNSAFWVLPAARNYLSGRRIDWYFIVVFSLIGLVGCYVGVLFITSIPQRALEVLVGSIILALAAFAATRRDAGLKDKPSHSVFRRALAYPFALVLGFYETIFGSGNGILCTALSLYTRGFDFMEGLGHYYVIAFVWTLFSAVLLMGKGYVDVPIMACSAAGAVSGAYIGSAFAVKRGNAFIKILFVAIGTILGLKLLLGI